MDANRAEIGHLTANTASLGGFTMLEPRTFANNKAVAIRCINNNKTTVVAYSKQIKCEKIQWSVNFVSADDLDQNVSNQNNLFSKQGWWVLFEWDVLPRIKEVAQINLCVDQANNTAKGCWQLPDASQPPLIAVWGKPAVSFNTVDNSYHLYGSSHSAPLFTKDNIAGLKAQYDYLSNLFAASEKSNKSMNIVGGDLKLLICYTTNFRSSAWLLFKCLVFTANKRLMSLKMARLKQVIKDTDVETAIKAFSLNIAIMVTFLACTNAL